MAVEGDVLIRVLGPVSASAGEEPIALGGPMQHRLLAILAAAKGETVSRFSMIEQLWAADSMPADPNRTVRNVVARLRVALGDDAVVTRGQSGYALGEVEVDADRFEELIQRGWKESGSLSAVEIWSEAVGLWQGAAFEGYEDLPTVAPRAARLDELRAEATEAWLGARLAAGERGGLVADVNSAVRRHPLRDKLRGQQMTVLNDLGRQAEALRAFQDFREVMTDIGLEPSAEITELDARIAAGTDAPVAPRRTLRGYRIGAELGRGAFSVVFRARQPAVDREVAIKQIRSELANRPEFIAQFEAEAQLVARLEHPHIVPLYDYWREPGSAYLVMRYLRKGSLADEIAAGPMPPERVAEIALQVASALDEAHRLGITHGDVKPANILLDDRNRAYLSDFGIAVDEVKAADPSQWLSHGTPVYASPEQLRREPIDRRTDVHGFGIVLYEALVGQIPFPIERTNAGLLERQLNDPIPLARTLRPELPAAVDTVLQRATAKRPEDRFATAREVAVAFGAAVGLTRAEPPAVDRRNPYKGLRPFTEADAADFAGRERLTDRLLQTVGRHRLTMVLGPSGSGKSSVVAAGLVPAVRAGRLAGSGTWFVTSMTPGVDPFAALDEAMLRIAVEPPTDLARQLEADPRSIHRLWRRLTPTGGTTLLVIDQFEELYTLAPANKRERFLDLVLEATRRQDSAVRVVATLRADFYHHPLRSPGLATAIDESTVAVHPMASDELERAIVEPARAVGADFESGLVARLIADVADEAGALPMLQHLLSELYERRVEGILTVDGYEQLGGVAGALSRRADEVHDALTAAEQLAARTLLGRLVNLGVETTDTRRRVRRSDVVHDADAGAVIDRFGAARLLSFDNDPATREPTLELAHESLIYQWDRLAHWLREDRDLLRVRQLLGEAAANWDRQGREDADLYRGTRLVAALDTVGCGTSDLAPLEQAFLDQSQDREEVERDAERRINRRLSDLVDRQRRGNRRLRVALSAVAIAAAIALVAGLLAVQQRNQVAGERRDAEIANLVAESLRLTDDDPVLAGLLAVEAFRHDPKAAAPALFAALVASPGLDHSVAWEEPGGDRACGSLSASGAVLAPAATVGPIHLLSDDGTRRTIGDDIVCWAAADPNSRYAAGITNGSELRLWEISSGELVARRQLDRGPSALTWRPDGSALAVLHNAFGAGFERGDRLDVLNVPDLDRRWPADTFIDRPFVLDWSGDSQLLLVGSEAGGQSPALLSTLDADTGAVRSQLELDSDPATVDLSDNGQTAAVVFKHGAVEVIDFASGRTGLRLESSRFGNRAVQAWIVSDGAVLAVAQLDGTLMLLDPETGEDRFTPLRNEAATLDVEWSGSALRLVTADGVLQRVEVGRAGPSSTSIPLPPRIVEYERSSFGRVVRLRPRLNYTIGPASGRRVFVANAELRVESVDLDDPEAPLRQIGPASSTSFPYVGLPDNGVGLLPPRAGYVAYDADGERQVEVPLGTDLTLPLIVFDIAANEGGDVAILGREAPRSEGSAISELPVRGRDHVFLVDGLTGDHHRIALPDGVSATVVRVDPAGVAVIGLTDGRIARVARDSTIDYSDVEPGVAVRTLDLLPDGSLITVSDQGTMRLLQGNDTRLVTTAATDVEDVRAVSWADQAVTTDVLGSMRLWDLATGAQLALLRQGPGTTDAVAVIDNQARRVWVPGDRTLEAVSIDPSEWAETLCQRTSRDLTEAERDAHIPAGLRAEATTSGCQALESTNDSSNEPLEERNP